jgi:peptidoglycan hydrolase-like protein with peptidoglycan-binding domain
MNLKEGSTGSSVIKLQTALTARGLYSGTLDGIFGMRTKEAVIRYQQTQGLKTDGIVGEITAKSIGIKSFRILCCDGGGNTVRLRIFRGGFGHVETRYIASLQGFWFTEFSYPNRIDGGGVRGVLSARILQEVEKEILQTKGVALHQYFDLVAGTSTGSIITAALASKLNAANYRKKIS